MKVPELTDDFHVVWIVFKPGIEFGNCRCAIAGNPERARAGKHGYCLLFSLQGTPVGSCGSSVVAFGFRQTRRPAQLEVAA